MDSVACIKEHLLEAGFSDLQQLKRGPAGWVLVGRSGPSRVVIKVLYACGEDANAYWQRSFRREGELLTDLSGGPGMMRALATNVELSGKITCHVIQYAGEELQASGDIQAALEVVHQLLTAVAHLHGRGVVHRDIKPSNILVSGSTLTLADLGAARRLSDDSPDDLAYRYYYPFSPLYAAPELFAGLGLAAQAYLAADVWAVGACLYYLLTGQRLLPKLMLVDERQRMIRSFGYVMDLAERRGAYLRLVASLSSRLDSALELWELRDNPFSAMLVNVLRSFLEPDFRMRPTAEQAIRMVRLSANLVKENKRTCPTKSPPGCQTSCNGRPSHSAVR